MKYYEKIDGLRCVAISFVLIEHFGIYLGRYFSAGYYGVDLFFVISGFLITSILYKSEGTFWNSYKNFIGRRTLRIFPIYYLTVSLLYIFGLDTVRFYLGYLLTYTFNYAEVKFNLPLNPVSHFWSLCVEEQFYLIWPFVILLFKRNYKVLCWVTLGVIILGFSQMTFGWIKSINEYNNVNLLTRMGSLGFGGLAGILFSADKIPERFFKSRWVEYFTLFTLLASLVIDYQFRYILLAYCSFYLVIKCVHSDFQIKAVNEFLRNKTLVFIGSISYGIYLFHLPIGHFFTVYVFDKVWASIDFNSIGVFGKVRYWSWIIKLPLYSGLSILVAFGSFKFIERPILALKDRYFKVQ